NTEKTFTVTLFLPNEGDPSFETIPDLAAARKFFEDDFADALPLMPNFDEDFINNPTSGLSTLYCDNWHLDGRVVLLGDAAHAMVPFHGQGMNCAFEDCLALVQHIEQSDHWEHAFSEFERERKPNALAIQTMALENYVEMRDLVDDPDFLLQRQLERALAERHPGVFIPRYAMVSFSRVPYRVAYERGLLQRALLIQATEGKQSLAEIDVTKFDEKIAELFA
nr:FAD-dependent monooxygenase [Arenimonas sp.]